jgi:hypothetical protein
MKERTCFRSNTNFATNRTYSWPFSETIWALHVSWNRAIGPKKTERYFEMLHQQIPVSEEICFCQLVGCMLACLYVDLFCLLVCCTVRLLCDFIFLYFFVPVFSNLEIQRLSSFALFLFALPTIGTCSCRSSMIFPKIYKNQTIKCVWPTQHLALQVLQQCCSNGKQSRYFWGSRYPYLPCL